MNSNSRNLCSRTQRCRLLRHLSPSCPKISAVLADPLHAHEFNWIVRTSQARLELFALYSARKGKSLANSPMLLEVLTHVQPVLLAMSLMGRVSGNRCSWRGSCACAY
jgi:hypothetical protein